MKSANQKTGPDAVAPLSAELVLTVNPRVTFRWTARSVEADNRSRQTTGSSEESVGLSTLGGEERTLLALADGRRTVEDLAHLAGMTTVVAAGHLRALCDRGILVSSDGSAASRKIGSAEESSKDILASPEITDALMTGPVEYDYSVSAEGGGGPNVNDEGLPPATPGMSVAEGADTGASAISPATESGGSAAPAPDAAGSSARSRRTESGGTPASGPLRGDESAGDQSPPSTSPQVEQPQPKKSGSGPNATLWWIPRPVSPREGEDTTASPDKPSGDDIQAPRPRRNGPEPTVVVFGSPPSASSASSSSVRSSGNSSSSPVDPVPVPATPSAPAAGSDAAGGATFRVGAYEVAMRLAQGAMGSIYVCRRTGAGAFQRLYTLKVIRQHASQTDVAVKSFVREARIGGMLNHPNLQVLVDVGTYQNQPFLILDYIEGTSLSDLLTDDRRPPPSVVVPVILDLLRGLQYLHDVSDQEGRRLGLVHADVSPQNVLVGVDGSARLTDFGSARQAQEIDAVETDPVVVGKPAFMAPEQLLGQSIDSRTDIFSLGAVMWTALTGQSLFAAETYDQTVMKVLKRKIPPPSEFGGPRSFDAIVLKALSRSPEGRYASAEEMARELLDAAAADRLVASASEVGQWVRREFGEPLADRRRKIQVAFGAASRVQDSPIKVQVPRPHRVTPRTADGHEKVPTKTVQLDAVSIAQAREAMAAAASSGSSAPPASSGVRRRPHRRPARASRGQWTLVILSAILAAGALGLAISYFVSSLTAPPKRPSRGQTPGNAEVRAADPALPESVSSAAAAPRASEPPATGNAAPRAPRDMLPAR